MDISKLALEAGAAKFYPERQSRTEDNYLVTQGFLERFAAKILEEERKKNDQPSE